MDVLAIIFLAGSIFGVLFVITVVKSIIHMGRSLWAAAPGLLIMFVLFVILLMERASQG